LGTLMPFIVTTRREGRLPGREHDAVWSRQAVATLEEARESARQAAVTAGALAQQWDTALIPESGGTVGPFSDGTRIEVMAVDDAEYARAIDAGMNGPAVPGRAEPNLKLDDEVVAVPANGWRGAVEEIVWLRNQIGDVRGMQSDGATPEEMDHALGRALSGERARLDFDRERGQ
jgi:hypothetical protein